MAEAYNPNKYTNKNNSKVVNLVMYMGVVDV